MLVKNKSNKTFRQGGVVLYPYQSEDVPEAFVNHPIIVSAMNRGLIETETSKAEAIAETLEVEVTIGTPEAVEETPEGAKEEPAKEPPKKRKKAE